MKYAFITAHAREFGVQRMCRVLRIQRSSYYAWKQRKPSSRIQADQTLLELIRIEHTDSHKTYGSPRIYRALQSRKVPCGRHRIERLMRADGLLGCMRQTFHPRTTQRQAGVVPAPNRLHQEFQASEPNQKWVSDFTYIATREGWLYLAVVLDLYSRKVIGWAMRQRMDTLLVENALHMALQVRQPAAGFLHHSDQGSQYTSQAYCQCLRQAQAQLSMSGAGNCYDNAVIESFFGTLKTECVTRIFSTCQEARTTIFEYMETWYNRKRLHSTLGYLSPDDFEMNFTH